ncbi:hypothetical protein CapIbe_013271, partial [Capra ibex]
AETSVTLNE